MEFLSSAALLMSFHEVSICRKVTCARHSALCDLNTSCEVWVCFGRQCSLQQPGCWYEEHTSTDKSSTALAQKPYAMKSSTLPFLQADQPCHGYIQPYSTTSVCRQPRHKPTAVISGLHIQLHRNVHGKLTSLTWLHSPHEHPSGSTLHGNYRSCALCASSSQCGGVQRSPDLQKWCQ